MELELSSSFYRFLHHEKPSISQLKLAYLWWAFPHLPNDLCDLFKFYVLIFEAVTEATYSMKPSRLPLPWQPIHLIWLATVYGLVLFSDWLTRIFSHLPNRQGPRWYKGSLLLNISAQQVSFFFLYHADADEVCKKRSGLLDSFP